MFSEPARHRHRLPRINLGPRHVSLPDPATAGGLNRSKHRTPNTELQRSSLTSMFGVGCWMFDVFLFCDRRGFVAGLQNGVVQIGGVGFAGVEGDDDALVLKIDNYVAH